MMPRKRNYQQERNIQALASQFFAARNPLNNKSDNAIEHALTLGTDWWQTRVRARVKITPGNLATPCHLWSGAKTTTGYGQVAIPAPNGGSFPVKVHRLRYAEINGTEFVDAGHVIDHLCGEKLCVNPEHLEAVPIAVNSRRSRPLAAGPSARKPRDEPAAENPSRTRKQKEASEFFLNYAEGSRSQNAILYALHNQGSEDIKRYLWERSTASGTSEHNGMPCRTWNRGARANGYGQAIVMAPSGGSYSVTAHRLAYAAEYGVDSMKETHSLDHLCGEKLCIQPHHLEQVSHSENSRRAGESLGGRPRRHPTNMPASVIRVTS